MMHTNSFRPPNVKYPYSNLKYPTYHYEELIEDFLSSMYVGINFRVISFTEEIGIIVYDVAPNKIYNPSTFDPCYLVKIGEKDIQHISQYDFFKTFYSYIPDVVPYLIFSLVTPIRYHSFGNIGSNPDGSFEKFDLRELFYKEEGRNNFHMREYRINNYMQNNMVRYDEFGYGNDFLPY